MTYNYKNLSPFKFYILQNFPYIEEDFDAITNWQLFCKLGEEINKIINSTNLTGEQVENLTNAFNDLTNYVNNYFENLDVQDEINNKLDDMAESGELAEIITAYLNAKSILAYNTVQEMSLATNIINGSFLRTYGKISYNDGLGAFYKSRLKLETDVIDNDNIVALSDTTLIAEKIPDANINTILQTISNLEQSITEIENNIEEMNRKKWIFVGDSYSEGYTSGGTITSWSQILKEKMNLTNDNCTIVDNGGTGFANAQNSFAMLLDNLEEDLEVTDILIAGGYNDLSWSSTNILQGFADVKTVIDSKFPNSKVHIAFIGGTTNQYHGNIHLKVIEYLNGSMNCNFNFLNNVWYPLYSEERLATDGIHPNLSGQNAIANALYQAFNGGYNYYLFNDIIIDNSQSDLGLSGTTQLHHYSNNNLSTLSNYSGTKIYTIDTSLTIPWSYNGSIKIGKLQSRAGIIGTNYYNNSLMIIGPVIVQDISSELNGYYTVNAQLYVNENGDVYLKRMPSTTDDHSTYLSFTKIRQIQIPVFSSVFNTDVY